MLSDEDMRTVAEQIAKHRPLARDVWTEHFDSPTEAALANALIEALGRERLLKDEIDALRSAAAGERKAARIEMAREIHRIEMDGGYDFPNSVLGELPDFEAMTNDERDAVVDAGPPGETEKAIETVVLEFEPVRPKSEGSEER